MVRMVPFTLQLLYGSSGYTQEISVGIDAGSQHIGVSATTEQVVLFEAEVQPRTDIQALLATRRQFRRARRRRKTRYRKCRCLNRKKRSGWLASSVQHKVAAHLKTIRLVHKMVPVSRTTIEVAQFDIQKLRNPETRGLDYQQGPQLGFWNARAYVLARDRHVCQWCQGKSKDSILTVHHIESRKTGGDSPENLVTVCQTCHDLIHRTHQEHKLERTQWQPTGSHGRHLVPHQTSEKEQPATSQGHDQEGGQTTTQYRSEVRPRLSALRLRALPGAGVLCVWSEKFRLL